MAAVASMVRGRAPHAVLLVGPEGVGKTTLALDLAAGLLCGAEDQGTRPCGACRGCRLVFGDVHPDVHRLRPEGPGRQVVIGGSGTKGRGVRDLIADLALLPVEGGARVAIVEAADRMNEDAQAAILKTLEEPPPAVTIILCADSEERLLPTIRSRCARLRLGPVGVRDIEAILDALGVADGPTGARLARIAGGRPGLALAWAADDAALLLRDELARTLLDLLGAGPAARLAGVRAAAGRAARLGALAASATGGPPDASGPRRPSKARRGASGAAGGAGAAAGSDETGADPAADGGAVEEAETDETAAPTRTPATERRRAADALVALWTDVARDLALVAVGRPGSVRDLRLLDDTTTVAARLEPTGLVAFLGRLGRAALLVRGNAAPELVLDDLALHWTGMMADGRGAPAAGLAGSRPPAA